MTSSSNNNNKQPVKPCADLSVTYDDFMRLVSHELRTPVHLIQGYGELLADGALGNLLPQQKDALKSILQSASRLNTVVEHITTLLTLDVSAPALRPMTLVEIVVAVMVSRHEQAIHSQIALTIDQESDLPPIQADAQQLYQAVDSLVDNALKFTPAGGTVKIKSYRDGDSVCLAVEDSGVGISAEAQAHIFSLFYQADSTTTRHYEGTGLGLSVAKAVVEAHGGQISMSSTPDVGSSFVIKLPAADTAAAIQQGGLEDLAMRTRHILVVDDEEFVALVLKDGLESLPDCTVTTANDGEQALALCKKQTFDLIITDYKMPVIDGLTLADHIRHLYPLTKIVMITAHVDEHLEKQASQMDIQRLLQKPVKLAEIRTAASEVLAQNQED